MLLRTSHLAPLLYARFPGMRTDPRRPDAWSHRRWARIVIPFIGGVERAAAAAGLPLSTFMRQSSLGAASPFDLRAATARAEAVQLEARKLVAFLHGDVA